MLQVLRCSCFIHWTILKHRWCSQLKLNHITVEYAKGKGWERGMMRKKYEQILDSTFFGWKNVFHAKCPENLSYKFSDHSSEIFPNSPKLGSLISTAQTGTAASLLSVNAVSWLRVFSNGGNFGIPYTAILDLMIFF